MIGAGFLGGRIRKGNCGVGFFRRRLGVTALWGVVSLRSRDSRGGCPYVSIFLHVSTFPTGVFPLQIWLIYAGDHGDI